MQKPDFKINPQLMTDCHHLCIHDDFHLLLHKNATIPWVIMVPETQAQEIYQLPHKMQKTFFDLSTQVSFYLMKIYNADKMNVAAIGNIVEQLHIHVIARRFNDDCWPDVVWGKSYPKTTYSAKQLHDIKENILNLKT